MFARSKCTFLSWKSSYNNVKNVRTPSAAATKEAQQRHKKWRPQNPLKAMEASQSGSDPLRANRTIPNVKQRRVMFWGANKGRMSPYLLAMQGKLPANNDLSKVDQMAWAAGIVWHNPWQQYGSSNKMIKRSTQRGTLDVAEETSVEPFGSNEGVDRAISKLRRIGSQWAALKPAAAAAATADATGDNVLSAIDIVEYWRSVPKKEELRPSTVASAESLLAAKSLLDKLGATAALSSERRAVYFLLEALCDLQLYHPACHVATIVAFTEYLHSYTTAEVWKGLLKILQCSAVRQATMGSVDNDIIANIFDHVNECSSLLVEKYYDGLLAQQVKYWRKRHGYENVILAAYIGFELAGGCFDPQQQCGDIVQGLKLENPSVPRHHPTAPFCFHAYTLKLNKDLVAELRRHGWGTRVVVGEGRRSQRLLRLPQQLVALARWLAMLASMSPAVVRNARTFLRDVEYAAGRSEGGGQDVAGLLGRNEHSRPELLLETSDGQPSSTPATRALVVEKGTPKKKKQVLHPDHFAALGIEDSTRDVHALKRLELCYQLNRAVVALTRDCMVDVGIAELEAGTSSIGPGATRENDLPDDEDNDSALMLQLKRTSSAAAMVLGSLESQLLLWSSAEVEFGLEALSGDDACGEGTHQQQPLLSVLSLELAQSCAYFVNHAPPVSIPPAVAQDLKNALVAAQLEKEKQRRDGDDMEQLLSCFI